MINSQSNMLKKIFCFFIFSSITSYSFSQGLMHSVGTTISIMGTRIIKGGNNSSIAIIHTDATYFPRYNLTESESSSFSVGMPLSAGVSLAQNQYDESGVYFGFDVPVVVDYNFGAKSTPENEDKLGGYFGAGFGYTFTNFTYDFVDNAKAISYGPLARAGMRFGFPSSDTGQGMTIGIFYKQGLETEKFKTFGFNVLLDL